MRLVRNRAKCAQCLDVIESLHVHDWRQCACGTISVDGGLTYASRSFTHPYDVIELSEYTEDE